MLNSPRNSAKKYIKGYRNKVSGRIYYNATAQTVPSPWKYDSVERYCRDTQTLFCKDNSQQTPKNAFTQVNVQNINEIRSIDKLIQTRTEYVKVDGNKNDSFKQVIIIQKYIRRWLARKELQKRKLALLEEVFYKAQALARISKQDKNWLKELKSRLANPKSDEDFRLLFSTLQKWWNEEQKYIHTKKTGSESINALYSLLDQETKKIKAINKKKNMCELEKVHQEKEQTLKTAGDPKIWIANNSKIEVETVDTQTAKAIHNLYLKLSMKCTATCDRIELLKRLKETIKPYQFRLTVELTQLANREIDLHHRGIQGCHLEGLQNRIRDLFWQYAKTPVFNPEMEKLSNIGKLGLDSHIILNCAACKCFYALPKKTIEEKSGKENGKSHRKCKKCSDVENEAWKRKDQELYKRILKLLITEEQKMMTHSSIIHILQPNDIGYLIEIIWKHQSCFSGTHNDEDLELVRYDIIESWTPWNCLLVTRKEAAAVTDLRIKKYDNSFNKCVVHKHADAKRYFSTIPRFQPYLLCKLDHKKPAATLEDSIHD